MRGIREKCHEKKRKSRNMSRKGKAEGGEGSKLPASRGGQYKNKSTEKETGKRMVLGCWGGGWGGGGGGPTGNGIEQKMDLARIANSQKKKKNEKDTYALVETGEQKTDNKTSSKA